MNGWTGWSWRSIPTLVILWFWALLQVKMHTAGAGQCSCCLLYQKKGALRRLSFWVSQVFLVLFLSWKCSAFWVSESMSAKMKAKLLFTSTTSRKFLLIPVTLGSREWADRYSEAQGAHEGSLLPAHLLQGRGNPRCCLGWGSKNGTGPIQQFLPTQQALITTQRKGECELRKSWIQPMAGRSPAQSLPRTPILILYWKRN